MADSGIRDYPAVQQLGFPVYALGPAAPAHVLRRLAIDEDVPVGCAEVLVMPGDVLVGDGEGVVCIPRHVADKVAGSAWEQDRLEAFYWRRSSEARHWWARTPRTRRRWRNTRRPAAADERRVR